MCKLRLQKSIKELKHDAESIYFSSDAIMSAFYLEIADCDYFQNYVNEMYIQKYGDEKDHYGMKTVLMLDALYEVFNIE